MSPPKIFCPKVLTNTVRLCSNIKYEGLNIQNTRYDYYYMKGTYGMNREKTRRGPRISREVRTLIISQAIHDSKTMPRRALAVRLQDLIQRMGEVSPTEETLARMISNARNREPSELERPWSIGACAHYGISPESTPALMDVQKERESDKRKNAPGTLTIREARWIARLYPVAQPLINKMPYADESGPYWLSLVASSYVIRERVSEQMNEQYPNTLDLDKFFFAGGDPFDDSSLIGWWSTIPLQYQQAIYDAVEEDRLVTLEDIRRFKKRPLTDEETKMINDCFDILRSGGLTALSEFVGHTPLARESGLMEIISSIIYSKAVWREEQ